MSFDYNTSRKHMVLPEYGRNIQKMVDYIKTVEDKDERNRLANAIVAIMGNLNSGITWLSLQILNLILITPMKYPSPKCSSNLPG
jgi:hypothetical protein